VSFFLLLLFVAAIVFLLFVRSKQLTIAEGFEELKKTLSSFAELAKPQLKKVVDIFKAGISWLVSHKKIVAVIACAIIVPVGAYAAQQALLSSSKPDQFLASFAEELDKGNLSTLNDERFFSDAGSGTPLIPIEYLSAFEKTAVKNSIQLIAADSDGQFSFKINNRGPYTIESTDVYEFPIFVRTWRIVDLNSATISWSQLNSDPTQLVTLGGKEISVADLFSNTSGLQQFRVPPFGTLKFSLSEYGFNSGFTDREIKLVSGPVTLTLDPMRFELPKDIVEGAVAGARAAITKCMNLQATGKSDCELLTWDEYDDRNESDSPSGDFKDEKIVNISWKVTECDAGLFVVESPISGMLTVNCSGNRAVKTKYVENDCYDKLFFGVYLYGCWGLKNSYGTDSEWFDATTQVPVQIDPQTRKITARSPKI
jgi:hypothetical protein